MMGLVAISIVALLRIKILQVFENRGRVCICIRRRQCCFSGRGHHMLSIIFSTNSVKFMIDLES